MTLLVIMLPRRERKFDSESLKDTAESKSFRVGIWNSDIASSDKTGYSFFNVETSVISCLILAAAFFRSKSSSSLYSMIRNMLDAFFLFIIIDARPGDLKQ